VASHIGNKKVNLSIKSFVSNQLYLKKYETYERKYFLNLQEYLFINNLSFYYFFINIVKNIRVTFFHLPFFQY